MIRIKSTVALALITALICGCTTKLSTIQSNETIEFAKTARPAIKAPVQNKLENNQPPRHEWAERLAYDADGPYPINLADIPDRVYDPNHQLTRLGDTGRIESPISDELAKLLRQEALLLPPDAGILQLEMAGPGELGPVTGTSFDSLDANDCCGGGLNVPPDSELAVGPNHIIAVVNVAFEIYDKNGIVLSGPITFSSFFNDTPGCTSTRVFDPNVIYDEEYDRFILGVDGNGDDYCVAATTGPDPTQSWNRYGFATDIGGAFFDYPHAGVGLDAIYVGANMFLGGFAGARVWAIDKFALYSGSALSVVTRSTGFEGTPQPMNLHGYLQGTWPAGGPHYILTDDQFNGATYGVWSWDDPFGADIFIDTGTVNLSAFTGITAGFPIDVPQAGSSSVLQANDWRVQDAEYRNGKIWMTNGMSCNPGSGTVDCVRWAQIDPSGPAIVDAGVLSSNGEYRFFPDIAANDCDDMVIGYSKSSSGMFPAVFVAGRESGDTPGTVQAEVQLKSGERSYDSFQRPGPHRWGDYSGMTIDPDGQTFWYLGEYSKNITNFNLTTWGNHIGSLSFPGCGTPQPPGKAINPAPVNGAGNVDINADIDWSAGSEADSHEVYFGSSFPPAFQTIQTGTSFDPGLLTNSSTYYWRIDETNSVGTTTGDTWSFDTEAIPVPPAPASNPDPADGAIDVASNTSLTWSAGEGADSHDVYFGTNSPPASLGNQTGATFDPGTLASTTTYYWRIDEVNGAGTTAGTEWSFTTAATPTFHIFQVSEVRRERVNGPRYRGVVTITVHNADDSGIEDVLVNGIFDGDWSGASSGTTTTGGTVDLQTPPVKNGSSWTFCVDSANMTGWVFDESASAAWLCSTPQPVGSINGTVTDSDSTPIEGAAVNTDTGQSYFTGAGGNYFLTDVPTGTRTVTVSASGFDSAEKTSLVLEGEENILNFTLIPSASGGTGTLKGTVRNGASRAKLSDVTVTVQPSGPSGTTNKGAKYSIQNVPDGSQMVTASKTGFVDLTKEVAITAGSTATLNFDLVPD